MTDLWASAILSLQNPGNGNLRSGFVGGPGRRVGNGVVVVPGADVRKQRNTKLIMQLQRMIRSTLLACAGFALAAAGDVRGQALDDTLSYTNSFDTSGSVASWIYWYGVNPGNSSMVWDSTMDAQTNANSGSLLFLATLPQNNQEAFFGTFNNRWHYDLNGTHDATKYTNITVDVHVDPSSPLSTAGTFGNLQMGFYSGIFLGAPTIPASATNGWVRLTQPIDPSTTGISAVGGINFRIQTYDNYHNPIGTLMMWLDNVTMNVSPVQIPPPTLQAPATPTPGLNLFSAPSNGDLYQRTSLLALNSSGTSWVGAGSPVTYAVTITNAPAAAGYQTHLFLVTGTAPNETAPDYNETNLVWLNIATDGTGGATASFRYKINENNSNSNLFGAEFVGPASAGTLANVHSATVLGTWLLTFNNDTNVVITTPDGHTANFGIRPEVAANFADPYSDGNPNPIHIYVGAQPNATPSIGQEVVLSGFAYTNATTGATFNDNFTAAGLDTTIWKIASQDANCVQQIPPGSAYFVTWSRPDNGFSLQTSAKLSDASSWNTLTGPNYSAGPANTFVLFGKTWAYVPTANLNAASPAFFRLIQDH